jgi:hypothetical protein
MGLDLYAGGLARYHTGAWECEAQRICREAGIAFKIAYDRGPPKRLSKATAPLFVFLWRRRILKRHAHLIKQGLKWSEAGSTPYLARKPDHDGRSALVLAAAYAENPELATPANLPKTNETDPAYAAVSQNYLQSIVSILECHMFLPSAENFLIAGRDAVGTKRFITSTANLALALDTVNHAHWQADEAQISRWAERGALTSNVVTAAAGKIVHDSDVQAPENPFEHAAQFGHLYGSAEFLRQVSRADRDGRIVQASAGPNRRQLQFLESRCTGRANPTYEAI